MLVGGHGYSNPNASWLDNRGLWLSYGISFLVLHLSLLSIPFISTSTAWTLTNLIHSLFHLVFLHILKGSIWDTQDQGRSRELTQWEQIDSGVQFTSTRKFFTAAPVIMFLLTTFYTKYDNVHFIINFVSLLIVLLPKLPQFHEVRLFGINRY
ncbi:ORM1-like protein 3 [Cloeon dipterum]|uniref:ORM1-like protein 3 n=1 Tax=Cloeon dipterum TaxID=197152 RepID=UPI00321FFD63